MTATAAPTRSERVRRLAGELLARDGWSRAQLLEHQATELRALLDHAVARSPYYREALGAGAADRPLAELPTLSKATLIEQWDRVACVPGLTLAAGQNRDVELFTTSGASGLRGVFAYDAASWETWIGEFVRACARIGIGPRTRVVGIGAAGDTHMSKRGFAAIRSGPPGPELSALTPVPELVAALNAIQPEALLGYPSVAATLAAEQLAGRLRIAPLAISFGSEPVGEDVRAASRAAWGVEPAEYYASTEVPMIATSSREHPRALELTEDLAVVEVVDTHNRPVPPGVPGDKVLVTNLVNRALPLIRYELLDRVVLGEGPNPAGRPYAHLSAVDGRSADVLTVGDVQIHPLRFAVAVPGVRAQQIVRHREEIEVRIVLDPAAAIDTADAVHAAIVDAVRAAGAVPPPLRIVPVAALERDGAASKVKLVIDATVTGA